MLDTSLIFLGVIGLQACSPDVDIKTLLSYHALTPLPTSMLTKYDDLYISKAKLQSVVSVGLTETVITCYILDGSSILY